MPMRLKVTIPITVGWPDDEDRPMPPPDDPVYDRIAASVGWWVVDQLKGKHINRFGHSFQEPVLTRVHERGVAIEWVEKKPPRRRRTKKAE